MSAAAAAAAQRRPEGVNVTLGPAPDATNGHFGELVFQDVSFYFTSHTLKKLEACSFFFRFSIFFSPSSVSFSP